MPGLAATGKERATDICTTGRNGDRDATAGNYAAAAGNVAVTDGMMTGGITIDGMTTEGTATGAIIMETATTAMAGMIVNQHSQAMQQQAKAMVGACIG